TQVPCVDGVAKFSVKSPSSPGTAAVKAFFDDLSGEGKIFFAPHLRPMLLVGYGELALGYGSIKGNASLLDKDWIKEKGFAAAGRG
ncbi:MAG TPA: hypothetical protein PKN36_09795, partial [bacterium]|nr:hypothetical protein [bacterium]